MIEMYRACSQIHAGNEIRINCSMHGEQHWAKVTHVMRMRGGGLRVTTFTVDGGGLECLADPHVSAYSTDEVMSR